MGTLDHIDDISTDERRARNDPQNSAHRRLDDTSFNRARWPAFLGFWAVGGAAILIALIYVV